jgi:hypothetical protein
LEVILEVFGSDNRIALYFFEKREAAARHSTALKAFYFLALAVHGTSGVYL